MSRAGRGCSLQGVIGDDDPVSTSAGLGESYKILFVGDEGARDEHAELDKLYDKIERRYSIDAGLDSGESDDAIVDKSAEPQLPLQPLYRLGV